jgi:hypothetical protein
MEVLTSLRHVVRIRDGELTADSGRKWRMHSLFAAFAERGDFAGLVADCPHCEKAGACFEQLGGAYAFAPNGTTAAITLGRSNTPMGGEITAILIGKCIVCKAAVVGAQWREDGSSSSLPHGILLWPDASEAGHVPEGIERKKAGRPKRQRPDGHQ